MTSKIEELRNFVSGIFDKCEDKTSIENYSIINQKLGEIEEEQTKQKSEYQDLLKDYADVVKHSSYKNNENNSFTEQDTTEPLSVDDFIEELAINFKKK